VRAAAQTVGGAPVSIATGASAQSTGLMRVSGLNCIDRDSDNDGGSEKHSQREGSCSMILEFVRCCHSSINLLCYGLGSIKFFRHIICY